MSGKSIHVDFRFKTWERLHIPADQAEEVRELLASGEVTSPEQIYTLLGDVENETLFEGSEMLDIADNKGKPTIEAFEGGEYKSFWSNEPEEAIDPLGTDEEREPVVLAILKQTIKEYNKFGDWEVFDALLKNVPMDWLLGALPDEHPLKQK